MYPESAPASQLRTQRLWLAGFVAAVSAPLAYWLVLFAIEFRLSGGSVTEEVMRSLGMTVLIVVPLSLVVMLVFGYPLILLLRRHDRLSALTVCAGALAIGAAVATIFVKAAFQSDPVDVAIPLLGGVTGLFAGIVFSLVAGIPLRRIPT